MTDTQNMKICPFCGEEIKERAIKCRYCGEWLNKEEEKKEPKKIQCPFYCEEIFEGSVKCEHCGEPLKKNDEKPQKDTKYCTNCGKKILAVAERCEYCGKWLNNNLDYDTRQINKIAENQRASNIIWLIVAIIQILSVICIIAGIWNIIAVSSSWGLPEKIKRRDKDVPSYYEGIAGLIIMAVVNFFLGGIIGVALIGYDFYIRSLVIDNRKLFDNKRRI